MKLKKKKSKSETMLLFNIFFLEIPDNEIIVANRETGKLEDIYICQR